MRATDAVKNIPKKMIIWLLSALIIMPIVGSTQESHVESLDLSQTPKLSDHGKIEEEMVKVFRSETKILESAKDECKDNMFLDISGSGACESCNEFCAPLTNSTCPEKCKVYFLHLKLEEQTKRISKMSQNIQNLQKLVTNKSRCKEDEFWSPSGKCESCDRFCIPSMNVATCPENCKVHYLLLENKEQKGQISVMSKKIEELNGTVQDLKKNEHDKADFTDTWAAIWTQYVIVILITIILSTVFYRRYKVMRQEIKALSEESEKRKEEEQQRRFQQATLDQISRSSGSLTPDSTLSRRSASTMVKEVESGNGEGIPDMYVGRVEERPGGK